MLPERRRSLVLALTAICICSGPVLSIVAAGRAHGASGLQQVAESRITYQRAASQYLFQHNGYGFGVPPDAYAKAVRRMQKEEHDATGRLSASTLTSSSTIALAPQTTSSSGPAWNFIGPEPVLGESSEFGGVATGSAALANATGRITAIAIDPTTSGRIFVGTASGGVWMSTNGGSTFVPIFDAEPTQAIGSIALDPTTSPPTIYVGTGEADNSGDSYYGEGIFVSTDLGSSWTRIDAGGAFDQASIASLAIDTSQSPVHIFAAVGIGSTADRADASLVESNIINDGLWLSTDGGSTWTHIPFTSASACPSYGGYCPAEDVVIDPKAPSNVYVSIYQYGVFHSADGGSTWSMMTFPGLARVRV